MGTLRLQHHMQQAGMCCGFCHLSIIDSINLKKKKLCLSSSSVGSNHTVTFSPCVSEHCVHMTLLPVLRLFFIEPPLVGIKHSIPGTLYKTCCFGDDLTQLPSYHNLALSSIFILLPTHYLKERTVNNTCSLIYPTH